MSSPYLGEIRVFSFNFAPKGWALCAGQLMSIQQNAALFSLLGTTYGGNGVQNFQLPDLQGRAPMGSSQTLGTKSGVETVTLSVNQLPSHSHGMQASTSSANLTNVPAATTALGAASIYAPASGMSAMNTTCLGSAGTAQPHNNVQPSLVLNYCIALIGVFPTRN